MKEFVSEFAGDAIDALNALPREEIAKALTILQATYERGGRIYVCGNGGSLALATHFVADLNKTVFSNHLEKKMKRFQAIRLPSTESEITAWANDIGYDMIFAGPLRNYIQEGDTLIAISSSGNSKNIVKAVEVAKEYNVPVIGLSGFDGGALNDLSDAKILVATQKGEYEVVEGVHAVILHMMVKYFKNYFDYLSDNGQLQ